MEVNISDCAQTAPRKLQALIAVARRFSLRQDMSGCIFLLFESIDVMMTRPVSNTAYQVTFAQITPCVQHIE